jgi:hypothetical protein
MDDQRYHLTLSLDGRPAMQGWWGSEETARDRFRDWVGRAADDARVVLVDEETGETLTTWPTES